MSSSMPTCPSGKVFTQDGLDVSEDYPNVQAYRNLPYRLLIHGSGQVHFILTADRSRIGVALSFKYIPIDKISKLLGPDVNRGELKAFLTENHPDLVLADSSADRLWARHLRTVELNERTKIEIHTQLMEKLEKCPWGDKSRHAMIYRLLFTIILLHKAQHWVASHHTGKGVHITPGESGYFLEEILIGGIIEVIWPTLKCGEVNEITRVEIVKRGGDGELTRHYEITDAILIMADDKLRQLAETNENILNNRTATLFEVIPRNPRQCESPVKGPQAIIVDQEARIIGQGESRGRPFLHMDEDDYEKKGAGLKPSVSVRLTDENGEMRETDDNTMDSEMCIYGEGGTFIPLKEAPPLGPDEVRVGLGGNCVVISK